MDMVQLYRAFGLRCPHAMTRLFWQSSYEAFEASSWRKEMPFRRLFIAKYNGRGASQNTNGVIIWIHEMSGKAGLGFCGENDASFLLF